MDHGTRDTREAVQAPSGERPPPAPAQDSTEDLCRPLLPALIGPYGNGDSPGKIRDNGNGRVLEVHQRRGSVKEPSLHQVPGVGPTGE